MCLGFFPFSVGEDEMGLLFSMYAGEDDKGLLFPTAQGHKGLLFLSLEVMRGQVL